MSVPMGNQAELLASPPCPEFLGDHCSGPIFSQSGYRRSLFLGATPPHQATLFGPGAIEKINATALVSAWQLT